ncbi:MAG TPA: hypothetical protein VKY90_06605 [Candidatus Dormibacteraeota bacterium]|nr:hypothetical protein [Candidatus Dormibacteraeota bacterium]
MSQAEVNVHVSVRAERRPWSWVAAEPRRHGIRRVLGQIARATMAELAGPAR